jgi:hypothetical protein
VTDVQRRISDALIEKARAKRAPVKTRAEKRLERAERLKREREAR